MQKLIFVVGLLLHFSTAVPVEMFYPFGSNQTTDLSLPLLDDVSLKFNLSVSVPFYAESHTTLYVGSNGILSFEKPFTKYLPKMFPLMDDDISDVKLIAPFWADVDLNEDGEIWYRETNDSETLEKAKKDIQNVFPNHNTFQPRIVFIATWYNVGYFRAKDDKTNTFQCVLASDGSLSFVIFLYADGEIQWTKGGNIGSNDAVIGFNAGNGNESETVPGSLTEDVINITMTSNIGVPGKWMFQVDRKEIKLPNNLCKQENHSGIHWPETVGGTNYTYTCPNNPAFLVTRSCSYQGIWQNFDRHSCGVLAEQLMNISMAAMNLNTETLEETVAEFSDFISDGNEADQTEINLNTISNIISIFARFITESNAIVDEHVVSNVSQTLNSLLQWTESAINKTSSSRTVESFEEILSHYAWQIPVNSSQVFNFSSLSLNIERLSTENYLRTGRNLAVVGGSITDVDEISSGQLSPQQEAAISLPSSVFDTIRDHTDLGMYFGFYDTARLFPVSQESDTPRQPQVLSGVLTATIGQNMNLQKKKSLRENITISFRLKNNEGLFTLPGSERCVYWDFSIQSWLSSGCSKHMREEGVVICQCNHLTNFAVLVDTCSRAEDCQTATEILHRLNNLFTNLTTENYGTAVSMLVKDVKRFETEQNVEVLGAVAGYLKTLENFVNDSNVTIDTAIVNDTVQVVNSLLQWEPDNVRAASSSSIIQSFEAVISLYAQQLSPNENQSFVLPSITLVAESRKVESLTTEGRSFTLSDGEPILGGESAVTPGELLPSQDAAISLPASLFERFDDNQMNIGIFFALYDTPTLFPVKRGNNVNSDNSQRTDVGSDVLAATVGADLNFQDLIDNVTIVFRMVTEENFTSPKCVSWNFEIEDWTPQGCTTNDTLLEQGIVTCACNHLTNFAVLVDICLRQDGCEQVNKPLETALTFISFLGMSISIVCLVITIINLLIFKVIRQKDITKFHVQLCLALLLMLAVSFVLVGLSAGRVTAIYGGCMMVSVLVHYFTLVAVMWMGAEALLMFQKLVLVFVHVTKKFIVTVSIICWTLPIFVVLIPLIVDVATGHQIKSDIIVHRAKTSEEIPFCFLSHQGALWGAFLVPILAIIVFNIVMFICVIFVLVRHTRNKAARMNKSLSKSTIIRLMISISGVMFLFGLTWLFAILTFSAPKGLRETFDSLFVVFNSLQGFFIFLFLIVFNKEAVESWRELLSCGKYKSKLLHPSQIVFSATKHDKTGTTTLTLSTTGKFGSDISKSDNEYVTLQKYETQCEPDIVKVPLDSALDHQTQEENIKTEAV